MELLAAKHGSGDLTCDGVIDAADDAAQLPHLGPRVREPNASPADQLGPRALALSMT
jgi:hypothetical protein